MIKRIKNVIISILIFLILSIQLSKVIAVRVTDNNFFYTNKEEIAVGEMLEITLDMSKIKYDKFKFKLCSNLDTNSIIIMENISLEKNNNNIDIDIDKSKIDLNQIIFYYQVPETAQLGSEIELLAQIMIEVENNNEQNTNNSNEINNDANTLENNNTITESEYKLVESKQINIKIINNSATDDLPNTDASDKDHKTNSIPEGLNVNKSISNNKQNMNYSGNSMNISNMIAQTETAVYNGSNNNYLSSLEIEGETLNTTFNKENTTYFIKTNEKKELIVKAKAEDSSAKVYVTGNKNLKTGDNKILISVTAENGDVRYYRVFVNNN